MLNPGPSPGGDTVGHYVDFSNQWFLLGPFRIGTRGTEDQKTARQALKLTTCSRGYLGCESVGD